MKCHSIGLTAGRSFWRELSFGNIFEKQIYIICTEFKMTEFQSMLDFILDGKLEYCEEERLELVEIARIVLPDLKMFVEGNNGTNMTNPRNEQIRDLHLTFACKTYCKNQTELMHTN
jgi:hypothetical protein